MLGLSLVSGFFAPLPVHPLACLLFGFFAPGSFTPWLIRPLVLSPPGLFSPWLVRPLADSPPGLFAAYAWLICPLACSPPGSFAPSILILNVLPPLNTDNSTLRFRQFRHDDDNKRLCECLMLHL